MLIGGRSRPESGTERDHVANLALHECQSGQRTWQIGNEVLPNWHTEYVPLRSFPRSSFPGVCTGAKKKAPTLDASENRLNNERMSGRQRRKSGLRTGHGNEPRQSERTAALSWM